MECKIFENFSPMVTDDSNVKYMNIPPKTERLSMSCIASFEEWFEYLSQSIIHPVQ